MINVQEIYPKLHVIICTMQEFSLHAGFLKKKPPRAGSSCIMQDRSASCKIVLQRSPVFWRFYVTLTLLDVHIFAKDAQDKYLKDGVFKIEKK